MRLRGIIQAADLAENPPGGDRVELVLRLQGVGPGQPRRIVIPFELLVQDEGLDPDTVAGHGFEADVIEDGPNRWVVTEIAIATRRVLRDPE